MHSGPAAEPSSWGVLPSAWAAFLAGPVAWSVNLELMYALTVPACSMKDRLILHLSTLACLLATGLGGLLAWANWVWLGRVEPSDSQAAPPTGVRFLTVLGLIFAPTFALMIVSQWIAVFMIDPCAP